MKKDKILKWFLQIFPMSLLKQALYFKNTAGAVFLMALAPIAHSAPINEEDGLALQGYDAVSYITDKKATKGNEKFQAKQDDVSYYFSSQKNKELFVKAPQKYLPAYNGWCAYGMSKGAYVEIDPTSFKVIKENGEDRTYLFYKTIFNDTLVKWNKDEPALKSKAEEEWKKKLAEGEKK